MQASCTPTLNSSDLKVNNRVFHFWNKNEVVNRVSARRVNIDLMAGIPRLVG